MKESSDVEVWVVHRDFSEYHEEIKLLGQLKNGVPREKTRTACLYQNYHCSLIDQPKLSGQSKPNERQRERKTWFSLAAS